jgi:hypothetical protein
MALKSARMFKKIIVFCHKSFLDIFSRVCRGKSYGQVNLNKFVFDQIAGQEI